MDAVNRMARGAAKVRAVLADEQREMQVRAYQRVRPYLVGALGRLRRVHPAFKTVVFRAGRSAESGSTSGFALVFDDGTMPREAPRAFVGLRAACEELARLPEIERLTADDALWQVVLGTPQPEEPEEVIEQYRHVQDTDWQFWMRRPLRRARYYMRQAIYSRTVFGSHRPGYGKRIVDEHGTIIDEWIDPVELLIKRVLREAGGPVSLDPLCRKMSALAGFRDGFYLWDVLHACTRLQKKGALRRLNPRASKGDARFVLKGS